MKTRAILMILAVVFLASLSTKALANWCDWYLTSGVLAKDAQSYVIETDTKAETKVFATNDAKVVWIGKFTNPNAPLGRFSPLPYNLYIEWIAPNGKVFSSKRFTTNFMDKTTAHAGIYIATTEARNMPGTWKVVVKDWDAKEIIDQKTFEIRGATATATKTGK